MTISKAQRAQKAHWQLLGSIARCKGLITFHIKHDKHMSASVRSSLQEAQTYLQDAWWKEVDNNQFINLNLPRGF